MSNGLKDPELRKGIEYLLDMLDKQTSREDKVRFLLAYSYRLVRSVDRMWLRKQAANEKS